MRTGTNYMVAVAMLQYVTGFPSGAPKEQCLSMFPGHGVPAQTGTTNPYTITTDTQTFSCPGDEIKVALSGDTFRGFLCEPRQNTGTLLTDLQDPVEKQNKCGDMTSLTHVDNSTKSRITFNWKPKTTQAVQIVCTVVKSKLLFWVNITSPVLRYVQANCGRTETGPGEPGENIVSADKTPSEDSNILGTGTVGGILVGTADISSGTSGKGINQTPDKDIHPDKVNSKDASIDKDMMGGTDRDVIGGTDVDGRDGGGRPSGTILIVVTLAVCIMFL